MALFFGLVGLASGGRFVLGIGLSHQIVIENMFGLSFDKPVRHIREYPARCSCRCRWRSVVPGRDDPHRGHDRGGCGHRPSIFMLLLRLTRTYCSDKSTAAAIEAMGGRHHDVGPTDVHVDKTNSRHHALLHERRRAVVVFSAEKMVDEVLRLASL